jgi:hypothetical protein
MKASLIVSDAPQRAAKVKGYDHVTVEKSKKMTRRDQTSPRDSNDVLQLVETVTIVDTERQNDTAKSVSLSQSPALAGTVFERRAINYFRSRTALALSGYFGCSTWDPNCSSRL